MDAGGRATHGAVAEDARAESRVGNSGRDVQVSREGRMPVVTGGVRVVPGTTTESPLPPGSLCRSLKIADKPPDAIYSQPSGSE